MTQHNPEDFGANQGFIEDLYSNYLSDHSKVQPQWRELFRRWEDEGRKPSSQSVPSPRTTQAQINIHATSDSRLTSPEISTQRADLPPAPRSAAQPALTPYAEQYQLTPSLKPLGEEVTERLKGAAKSVAANMDASIEVPTATSFRQIPAKIMFDNRALVNEYLQATRGGKISFTHLIGYALVEALVEMPEMNNSYAVVDGKRRAAPRRLPQPRGALCQGRRDDDVRPVPGGIRKPGSARS